MRLNQILIAALAAALWVITVSGAVSDERILKFVSEIDVQTDGSLIVTETITVRAEGQEIKRGIFRDIPLRAKSAGGWEHDVPFELIDVLKDGKRENKFTRENGRGVRIYIGNENVILPTGEYTYTITYRMGRQVRFFTGYDEVYWNATGNEWIFPIDEAVAKISLPPGARVTQSAAYTGGFGDTGTAAESVVSGDGRQLTVTTTQPLAAAEGLTVAAGFTKGVAVEPTQSEKWQQWFQDQRLFVVGSAGAVILALYYFITWALVGRDPKKGVIFPRFKAPDGISPALANYVTNRGLSGMGWIALSAACLSLANKGRMILDKDGKKLVLSPVESVELDEALPKGEAVLDQYLRGRGSPLKLSEKNGESIRTLGDNFRAAINDEYKGVYFRANGVYIFAGFVLSVLAGIILFYFGDLSEEQYLQSFLFGFFGIFSTAISFGLAYLVHLPFKAAGGELTGKVVRWFAFAAIAGAGLYGSAWLMALIEQTPIYLPMLPLFLAALLVMFILYATFIDIPTTHGRQVMDEIEGLKLYLSVAEKERLNMSGVPEMSVVHFEKLLPFAVSLGVEKPWAESFESWLSTAAREDREYHPGWYRGRDFDSRDISRSVRTTASAMAGSFHSSLPVSDSSSSGSSGGGSSGGGGGGGGGGGW